MDPSIFKPCDIRGRVDEQLTDDAFRRIGRAIGELVEPNSRFVVGRDARRSGEVLSAALTEGLVAAGLHVIDLGCLPTPMVYFANRRLGSAGCAIVTASHNPPQYNGLKWMIGNEVPDEDQISRIRGLVCAEVEIEVSKRRSGKSAHFDIRPVYLQWLQLVWSDVDYLRTCREMRIVVDPLTGAWARLARSYLQALHPSSVFDSINDFADPLLLLGPPDCSMQSAVRELCEKVERDRSDLGIIFDGDGDRVRFVDDKAIPLTSDESIFLLIDCFGDALQGQNVVLDVKLSDRVFERVRQFGGIPIPGRAGHTFMRKAVIESDAIFGGESSGHYYLRALDAGDDGLFVATLVIDYLMRTCRQLSDIRSDWPRVFITPELRLQVDPDARDEVLRLIELQWGDRAIERVDGLRVRFDDGWALLRPSVTEQKIICRVEGDNDLSLERIMADLCDTLKPIADPLWQAYADSLGGQ